MAEVNRFTTAAGRSIYQFSVRSFATLVNNIYIVSDGQQRILIDCGSGMKQTNDDLREGFAATSLTYGEPITLSDIDTILITHGHIDHYGGLPFVRQFTDAPVGVHILDRRVLSNHEERVVVASRRLENFLTEAGVDEKHRAALMSVYHFGKTYYRSTPVQFLLKPGERTVGDIDVYHVPGHCPGQVCLRVDDILLTADHILARTTPHQAPESITNHMGLAHYLASLDHISRVEGIRLGLGGHEDPIADIPARIAAIKHAHDERLNLILDICRQPKTTAEISRELFGRVESYHVLLALEETGAHVEYLYQRGELIAANVKAIESDAQPVIQYICA